MKPSNASLSYTSPKVRTVPLPSRESSLPRARQRASGVCLASWPQPALNYPLHAGTAPVGGTVYCRSDVAARSTPWRYKYKTHRHTARCWLKRLPRRQQPDLPPARPRQLSKEGRGNDWVNNGSVYVTSGECLCKCDVI